MKFRKKPVEIEATQFFSNNYDYERGRGLEGVIKIKDSFGTIRYAIETLEGRMAVKEGDWIIKGVKGEFYPCKPDIFEMTYEKLD